MKISGVVVWYNPTSDEKENIKSYLPYLEKLFIIDNSINKNVVPKVDNKIEYIFNNENIGISSALNIAVNKSLKSNCEWLLTMDQDSKFNNNDLEKIIKEMKNYNLSSIGIVTPYHKTKLHVTKPKDKIDYPLDVMTSGNLINLNICNDVGKFKDELFIDGVDIEYCLRLKKKNYKIMRFNKYEIEHNLGNIIYKRIFNKEFLCTNHNYIRVYYRIRNYNYIKEMYQDIAPEFCNRLVKIKSLIWCIIFYENDKIRKLKSIFCGYRDFKKNIYGKYNPLGGRNE